MKDQQLADAYGVAPAHYTGDVGLAVGLLRAAVGQPEAETIYSALANRHLREGPTGLWLMDLIGSPTLAADIVDELLVLHGDLSATQRTAWRVALGGKSETSRKDGDP